MGCHHVQYLSLCLLGKRMKNGPQDIGITGLGTKFNLESNHKKKKVGVLYIPGRKKQSVYKKKKRKKKGMGK